MGAKQMAKAAPAFDTSKWAAMNPETRPINELLPYARNSRTHTDAQVAEIAAAMREWGWTNPVLIDEDGMIIAGHGRVMAARRLGIEEIPVIIARGWSDEQKRAYVIADNKLAENAEWNDEVLLEELQALQDIDVALTGFQAEEVDDLVAALRDDEPEEPKKAKKKKIEVDTEVWVLGSHKVVTGGGVDQTDLKWLIEQWQEYSGREAVRESDGATYFAVMNGASAPKQQSSTTAASRQKEAKETSRNEDRAESEADRVKGSSRKPRKAGAQQKRTEAAKRRR